MKTHDVETLTIEELNERERDAYAAGDTERANLYALVIDLRAQIEALEDQIKETETLEYWERFNGPAEAYKQFFFDCFEHLDGHYPAPSVTSEYDKRVIFDAISNGEQLTD